MNAFYIQPTRLSVNLRTESLMPKAGASGQPFINSTLYVGKLNRWGGFTGGAGLQTRLSFASRSQYDKSTDPATTIHIF
jgi:hypothetical protein